MTDLGHNQPLTSYFAQPSSEALIIDVVYTPLIAPQAETNSL